MKRLYTVAATLFCAIVGANAQKQSDPLLYNKERVDSLFNNMPKLISPIVPSPKEGYTLPEKLFSETPGGFEANNPGATVISKTVRGTIYNMPLDNMAVLVPDMSGVEKMPGSSQNYKPAPPAAMPNPLYRRHNKP